MLAVNGKSAFVNNAIKHRFARASFKTLKAHDQQMISREVEII